MITEQQYQRLMKEYEKTGVLGTAAVTLGLLAAGRGQRRR